MFRFPRDDGARATLSSLPYFSVAPLFALVHLSVDIRPKSLAFRPLQTRRGLSFILLGAMIGVNVEP